MIELKFETLDELRGTLDAVMSLARPIMPAVLKPLSTEEIAQFKRDMQTAVYPCPTVPEVDEAVDDDGEVGTVAETQVDPGKPAGKKRGRKPKLREPETATSPEDIIALTNAPNDTVLPDIKPEVVEQLDELPEANDTESEATESQTTQPEAKSTQTTSTLDTNALRAMCIQVKDALDAAGKEGMVLVTEVLRKYGGERAHNVPQEKIAECHAELEALSRGN